MLGCSGVCSAFSGLRQTVLLVDIAWSPCAPTSRGALRQLRVLLQKWFLHEYARVHTCEQCHSLRTVGVDNEVGLAARVCAYASGGDVSYTAARVLVSHGCTALPRPRSVFCAMHVAQHAAEPLQRTALCPADHPLQQSAVPVGALQYSCDVCTSVLPPQSSVWSCSTGCEFDVCPRCIAALPPAASSVPSSAMQSSPAAALAEDEKEFDGCGLAKPPPAPGSRRSGGVLTLVLACGTVCHVSACAGFESATQIYGMLGDVRSVRELDYVVYDNACVLRRFVANKVARVPSTAGRDLATMAYVLDRFHEKGYKACLNPRHRLYEFLVRMGAHPRLQTLNSSQTSSGTAGPTIFSLWCGA